ncbi:MAG: hypothetical protein AVDCRST_MAG30-3064, partial [uncultured Solirubrobacteraceae bacterium]
ALAVQGGGAGGEDVASRTLPGLHRGRHRSVRRDRRGACPGARRAGPQRDPHRAPARAAALPRGRARARSRRRGGLPRRRPRPAALAQAGDRGDRGRRPGRRRAVQQRRRRALRRLPRGGSAAPQRARGAQRQRGARDHARVPAGDGRARRGRDPQRRVHPRPRPDPQQRLLLRVEGLRAHALGGDPRRAHGDGRVVHRVLPRPDAHGCHRGLRGGRGAALTSRHAVGRRRGHRARGRRRDGGGPPHGDPRPGEPALRGEQPLSAAHRDAPARARGATSEPL